MTSEFSKPTQLSTGQLLKALLKKARWYDYIITIVWLGLLGFTGSWYAQFSTMGFTEATAAVYGLGFFVLTLVTWPVIRTIVYLVHKRSRSH